MAQSLSLSALAAESENLPRLAEGASECEPEGQAVREANCRRARKGALAACRTSDGAGWPNADRDGWGWGWKRCRKATVLVALAPQETLQIDGCQVKCERVGIPAVIADAGCGLLEHLNEDVLLAQELRAWVQAAQRTRRASGASFSSCPPTGSRRSRASWPGGDCRLPRFGGCCSCGAWP